MFIEVNYWEVDCVNPYLLVILHHLHLIHTSERQVTVGLHVEDAGNAGLVELVNVCFRLRIRPQPYSRLAYLIKLHMPYKVGIGLLYMTVDNEDWKDILPLI